MTTARFKNILLEVTARTFADMRSKRHIYKDRAKLPFWPTTYDINCGWCEDWGTGVEAAVPEATGDWLRDPSGDDHDHYAVLFRGLWYDAECLEGVKDFHDLPLIKNQRVHRTIVLKGRMRGQRDTIHRKETATVSANSVTN